MTNVLNEWKRRNTCALNWFDRKCLGSHTKRCHHTLKLILILFLYLNSSNDGLNISWNKANRQSTNEQTKKRNRFEPDVRCHRTYDIMRSFPSTFFRNTQIFVKFLRACFTLMLCFKTSHSIQCAASTQHCEKKLMLKNCSHFWSKHFVCIHFHSILISQPKKNEQKKLALK